MRISLTVLVTVLLAGCEQSDSIPVDAKPQPMFEEPQKSLAVGSATLSWLAPQAYTDLTPITALEGFKIYYSQDQGAVQTQQAQSVTVGVTESLSLEDLKEGTWYFAVAAIDNLGTEGLQSEIVSKHIVQGQEPPQPLRCENRYVLGRWEIQCN